VGLFIEFIEYWNDAGKLLHELAEYEGLLKIMKDQNAR
jgi:hypothetical protein